MTRRESFTRPWAANWLDGRWLIPLLTAWGRAENGVVLDVGCGESPFRDLFAASRYLRADIRLTGGHGIVCRAEQLPVAGQSCDTVLLLQVLGDSPDPAAMLRELHRVLRPGGRLVIVESMAYPEHDLPHDYFRVMPAGLEHLAAASGFTVTDLERLGSLFSRVAKLWNVGLMGPIAGIPGLRWLSRAGTLTVNLASYLFDRAMPRPRFAPDYAARLVRS